MKKLLLPVFAAAFSFCAASIANAAIVDVVGEPLSSGGAIGVEVDLEEAEAGNFSIEGSFLTDGLVTLANVFSLDVTSNDGDFPRILGMDLNLFSSPGGVGFLGGLTDFTDPMTGVSGSPDNFAVDLTGLTTVYFILTGFAEASVGGTFPNVNFDVAASDVAQVPLPAALPLFLMGLAGFGFASRRKKTA